MIIPCPVLPRRWSDFPVTWSLVAANIFIFLIFFAGNPDSTASDNLTDRDLRTAGRLLLSESQASHRPAWLDTRGLLTPERLETYGSLAIRDRAFLESLEKGEIASADPIALKSLTEAARKFHSELQNQPLHRFGLSSERNGGFAWMTYQFAHAGLLHLLSNLIFLVLMGWALETRLGGSTLLATYLLGGSAGGAFFLFLYPQSVIPMIGASGSVSALIAAYALSEPRRRIRYYYFVMPFNDLHGFIYLPTLLIFPLFLVSDLASLIAHPPGMMSGVAYSAHVGGALLGAAVAVLCRVLRRNSGRVSDSGEAGL